MTDFRDAQSLRDRVDRVAAALGDVEAIRFLAEPGLSDDAHIRLTYVDWADQIRRRATALLCCGVKPGETIAAFLPLSATSYPTFVAAMVVGTVAPLNYLLEVDALVELVSPVGATTLLTTIEAAEDAGFADKVAAVKLALPNIRHIVFGEGKTPRGAIQLDERLPAEGAEWPASLPNDISRNIVLMLTGGTTGKPKVVPHTERMYLALFESGAHAQGMLRGDRVLSPLPLYHTSGTLNVGLIPLMAGASIVIPSARGFRDPDVVRSYWELVQRFNTTVGAAVPTALAGIAAQKPTSPNAGFRHILSGGAPMPPAVAEAIRFNTGALVVNGWGMTETCGFSVLNPLDDPRDTTVGLPFDGVEIEIRLPDADGQLLSHAEPDRIGELVVRGATVIKRYLDDHPGAFTPDEWLRTGDLARIDHDGHLAITGRVKDIIIRGGHNIDPSMIENAAYRHPAVELAAAIGRPDSYAGEVPMLLVQLKAGQTATEQEVLDFVRPLIAERAAVPKAARILPALPLSGPGKISKLALRHAIAGEVLQSEIDEVAGENVAVVAIVDHPLTGIMADITPIAELPASARAVIDAALGRYTIATRWTDGVSQ